MDCVVEGFDLDRVGTFITGAGFSVFVAVWFMVKHDKRLDELSQAIHALREFLQTVLVKRGSHGEN
jgi:hypothetical protein